MSSLIEKTIGELLGHSFFIPSYQRGYRWAEQEVEDLLNDIWEFITKANKKENEWYCLQPIVVKSIIDSNYEVLDGQQRLTTILLILKHLERFIESDKKCFDIEYQTRNTQQTNSKEFLINIGSKNENDAKMNIDYFHIYLVYQKIISWFKQKANQGHNSISSKFITPFLEKTKVIWYEVPSDKDSIEIFTRINMGKIRLTNAELIKALFLNRSNYKNSVTLKQLEIASEWDRIEYALQNEEMWLFINQEENHLDTKIEFIFNLMFDIAKKDDTEAELRKLLKLDNEALQKRKISHPTTEEKFGSDGYSTFRFFSEKFKSHNEDEIESNWRDIKSFYQIIEEWFTDRELYHNIGYLITTGTDIKDLIRASKGKKKLEFKEYLNDELNKKIACENISELEYDKDNNNNLIKKIILLHNIKTMLSNKNESSRFPFYRYKKDRWDIEHIHATATGLPSNVKDQIVWFKSSQEFIDNEDLNLEITKFIQNSDTKLFEPLANKVLSFYAKKGNINKQHEDNNNLSNLVLLDSGTNRSYKNAVFPVKRKSIIEKEKKGTFIPICTKNVFLKYYSSDVSQMLFWGHKDGESYLENLQTTLYPSQKIISKD